ncbi:MAG: RnfABCDGE type electron transport complex subunit C [Bacilli bacterium]|jgi:electron transport complex protein RnfC|nr:RnfABCDGE type electron transport complex subunit C [Bacilli bacterium]MCH4201407.1 RnfABCDGE type electron transport complex subunit C [Bacilli bacterium]MCH4236158.1 RnfABCDGE type electron transport complex subunit C [Bacilli bacterium]
MKIFGSVGHQHIPGQKELTKSKESIILADTVGFKVYFPLASANGKPVNVLVKEGDHVLIGTKILERTDFYVPQFASVSGEVVANENRYNAAIGRVAPHLVIVSDGKQTMLVNPLKKIDVEKANQEEIVSLIKEAGIVGLGGAGFPTYIKYDKAKNVDAVLINGVECEPYLTTDYLFMKMYAESVVEGAEILRKAAGAKEAVIAFKVHKHPLAEIYTRALEGHQNVRFVEVPDLYPMGYEKTLIREIFHREYARLPIECGIVVNNAQTAASVYRALVLAEPLVNRLVTISGDGIVNPINIQVPIGTPVEKIVEAAGGYTGEQVLLVSGGPMTGRTMPNDQWVIQSSMGAVTVLKPLEYRKQSAACLRCGMCSYKCPIGLQPVEIKRALDAKDHVRLEKLETLRCVECGLCSYVCPSKIEISDAVKRAKSILRFEMARKQQK